MNLVRLCIIGTVVFVITGVAGTISSALMPVFVVVSLVEFALGTVAFAIAFLRAVDRSRTDATPLAAASRNTMPKPSCSRPNQRSRHSMANTSADASNGDSDASSMRPTKRTGAPARRARRSRRARSRPRPANTTCRSGRRRATIAAASMSTSNPLRGTRRLRPTITGASGSSPSERRAAARSTSSRGVKRPTSTPGGMSTVGSCRFAQRSASRAG